MISAMNFYVVALAVLLLDQATKQIIIRSLRLGEGFPILPGYFDITFVLNPGAAFSFLATLSERVRNPLFIAISVTAIVLIVVYHARFAHPHRLASFSLALVLGGA